MNHQVGTSGKVDQAAAVRTGSSPLGGNGHRPGSTGRREGQVVHEKDGGIRAQRGVIDVVETLSSGEWNTDQSGIDGIADGQGGVRLSPGNSQVVGQGSFKEGGASARHEQNVARHRSVAQGSGQVGGIATRRFVEAIPESNWIITPENAVGVGGGENGPVSVPVDSVDQWGDVY